MPATKPCGRQTQSGMAAWKNASGFAPCILPAGHRDPCESGPAPARRKGDTPKPPDTATSVYVEVSRELLGLLFHQWSEPVRIRIASEDAGVLTLEFQREPPF